MESESFTDGGMWHWRTPLNDVTAANIKPTDRDFAVYKCAHAVKWFCRFAIVLMVMYIIVSIPAVISKVVDTFYDIIHPHRSFTQKEGLQWLGASSDVIRGDYENNQDSLAEKAAKADTSLTDLTTTAATTTTRPAATTSAFTSRERLSTPEEAEMKKMTKQ
jgi:hypothetical protein